MTRKKNYIVECRQWGDHQSRFVPVKAYGTNGAVRDAKLSSNYANACANFKVYTRAAARREMMRAFKLARKLAQLLGE